MRKYSVHRYGFVLGVNALYRAEFISIYNDYTKKTCNVLCQCPVSGGVHFYPLLLLTVLISMCVNALYRAEFISMWTILNL